LPTLRTGNLLRDHALMEEARREGAACLDEGTLADGVVDYVRRTWPGRFGLTDVG
jgi:hypothetical protein